MSAMRVGIDIDGVLADMDGAPAQSAPGKLPLDFWESLDELEPGMVKQLAEVAAAEQWQVFFLTRRPETGGDPAQVQTERWLERHGFARPCVHIVRGSRGQLAHALGLNLLIDDTLDNCLDAALQSKAASILIWRGDPSHARKSLRGLNVDIAASLGDVLERMTRRVLSRNPKSTAAPPSPIATAAKAAATLATQTPVATADTLTRRTFAIAALLFGAFAVYGSLVPFQYRAMPIDEAFAAFAQVPYLALGIGSRADFVSNILLFIPLSFLLSGALLVDRRGAVRFTIAAVSIISFASALSVAIEFTQLFFPPRTVSLNDIVAETTGAAIGVALWGVLGPSLTAWTSAFLRQRGRPAFVVQLLTVYSAGFFVSQLMPFDLTIDLGELAQKYDEGRIVVVPFTHAYASPLALAWDYANDVVLWVPVGALAALGWTRPSGPRPPLHAGLIGAFIVGLIELGQLFVFTRYSDTTDLLTGSLGMAGGVAAAAAMTRTQPKVATRTRAIPTWWPVIGLAAWTVALAMYSWAPFDFVVDRDVLRQKVDLLFVVPFRNYYFGSEFHAFTEITRKFMLALPVGALLRLMFPSHRDRATARLRIAIVIVAAACLFTGLEAVQMLLPARFADVTDVLIAMTGVETARRLVDRLRHVTPARQESPLEVNRYAVR